MTTRILCVFLLLTNICQATNYYINDGSVAGDIYTSAIGNDGTGTGTAIAPYATITTLLSSHALVGSDTVFMDTGTYTTIATIGAGDAGSNATGYVVWKGAGIANTIFSSAAGDNWLFFGTNYHFVSDITINANGNHDCFTTNAGSNQIIAVNCTMNMNNAAGTSGCVQILSDSTCIAHCTLNTMGWGVALESGGDYAHIFSNTINNNGLAGTSPNASAVIINASVDDLINSNYCTGVAGTWAGAYFNNAAGTRVTVKNNYFAGYNFGVNSFAAQTNNILYHNSFYSVKDVLTQAFNGWDIQNNILYTTSNNAAESCVNIANAAHNPATLDYNLYYHPNAALAGFINAANRTNLTDIQGIGFETNGLQGDPLYATPGTGDLDLSSIASPAIDVANLIATVEVDIRNFERPATNTDIGAYEFEATELADSLHVLPVEFLYIKAQKKENENIISWATVLEINCDYFELQKSNQTLNFKTIGIINGHGTTKNIQYYELSDYSNFEECYYRIKQVDFDGSFIYSTVVSISRNQNNLSISQYGANVFGLHYSYNGDMTSGNWRCIDIQGKTRRRENFSTNRSGSRGIILKDLPTGFYILEGRVGSTTFSEKIFIE